MVDPRLFYSWRSVAYFRYTFPKKRRHHHATSGPTAYFSAPLVIRTYETTHTNTYVSCPSRT